MISDCCAISSPCCTIRNKSSVLCAVYATQQKIIQFSKDGGQCNSAVDLVAPRGPEKGPRLETKPMQFSDVDLIDLMQTTC